MACAYTQDTVFHAPKKYMDKYSFIVPDDSELYLISKFKYDLPVIVMNQDFIIYRILVKVTSE
jgi:hypothetical protein